MEKEYGIEKAALDRLIDGYVLNSGGTIDVERLRQGIEIIIRENNKALMNDVKELINKIIKVKALIYGALLFSASLYVLFFPYTKMGSSA
ncbi:hypothetical protein [Scopulibacillus daqui]|nr:hypothetical protein [Scopulibacillus daqui]